MDLDSTIAYYEKFFSAKCVQYREDSKALLTEKSFLLLNKVDEAPSSHLGTSLWHIGWSGVDGKHEFEWRLKQGIEVHTSINPLGNDHWMYFHGPNKEIVEVFTGNKNHSFEHIHLLASDVDKTMEWFKLNLGLEPEYENAIPWSNGLFKWNKLFVDNINIMVNGRPKEERTWYPTNGFKPTGGTSLDHIGFSFDEIESVYDIMNSNGVEIAKKIEIDPLYGFKSFMVTAPDNLLVEIVEEKPIHE